MHLQFQNLTENIIRRMPDMDFSSLVEILIISFLFYHILIWIKNTRAWSLLKGLAFILGFWLIAAYFHMTTILWLGRNIIGFAVTALIVVLQPELRKALEELGNKEIITNVLPFTGSLNCERHWRSLDRKILSAPLFPLKPTEHQKKEDFRIRPSMRLPRPVWKWERYARAL